MEDSSIYLVKHTWLLNDNQKFYRSLEKAQQEYNKIATNIKKDMLTHDETVKYSNIGEVLQQIEGANRAFKVYLQLIKVDIIE